MIRPNARGDLAVLAAIVFVGCSSGGGAARGPDASAGGAGGVTEGPLPDASAPEGGRPSGSDAATGGPPTDTASSGGAAETPSDAGVESPVDSHIDLANDSGGSSGDGACGHPFCEDFEQGSIDPTRWSSQTGGAGALTVQQQIVAHGRYAYHVHGGGAVGDFAMIIAKDAPAVLRGAGPLFGRAYVYANTNVGAHVELGFAGSTRDPATAPSIGGKSMNFNYMEFAEFSGSWQLGFDLFDPAPDVAKGFVEEASYPPAHDEYPAGTWSCVEWELGDDPDLMVLWVDGKQIDQLDAQHIDYTSVARTAGSVLDGKSSGIIGGFTFFGFGFHSYGASTAVDRYFDDIALDTKRVGCLPEPAAGG